MPGMFDGFSLNIFDDAIFDTKIQDIPTTRERVILRVPGEGRDGSRIVIRV